MANEDSLLSVILDLFDQLQFAETHFSAGSNIGQFSLIQSAINALG